VLSPHCKYDILRPTLIILRFSFGRSVNAHSSAYFTGFNGALSYNANPCSSFALSNVSLSDCIAGMLDGQEKAASLTTPYKVESFNRKMITSFCVVMSLMLAKNFQVAAVISSRLRGNVLGVT
jgi:hypothetical protein